MFWLYAVLNFWIGIFSWFPFGDLDPRIFLFKLIIFIPLGYLGLYMILVTWSVPRP